MRRAAGATSGAVLRDTMLHRRLELLGVHVQTWKRRPGWAAAAAAPVGCPPERRVLQIRPSGVSEGCDG